MDKRFFRIIFIVPLLFFLGLRLLWAQESTESVAAANIAVNTIEAPAVNQQANPVLQTTDEPAIDQEANIPSGDDKPQAGTIAPLEQQKETAFEDKKQATSPQETSSVPATENTGAVQPVEIDGDHVEFDQATNNVIIDGNVSIVKGSTTLRADHIEYSQAAKLATAKGHVVLIHPQGEIRGDSLTFNFEKMTGNFQDATIITKPYYGQSEFISKVGENKIEMTRGYITTCDLDKPHYKMYSKKVTMYPGDKVQAKNVRMVVGKMPLFYLPHFTQVIDGKKPIVTYTPGYDKKWGTFLLTTWSYYFNENLKGKLHLDYRERKDFASGADVFYKLPGFGDGLFKFYYMDERTMPTHVWEPKTTKTIWRERYKIEWRHKWKIDDKTQFVSQYYKLSDSSFLNDYFPRENERDQTPETFLLFTKNLDHGTLSFRMDKRINRFVSSVERLPEIGYSLSNQQIAGSNFYLQSNNLFSQLTYPNASPTDIRLHTTRLDSQNRISYPTKVGFIELTPFVGQRETFYTRTKESSQYDIIRSVFETGASLSTKFYRTFDVDVDLWGIKIDKLRHIINPMVEYKYTHTPSFPANKLDVFDSSIDSLTRGHKIDFTLENRFQTKRNNQNVDLLRIIGKTDFLLKENQTYDGTNILASKGGFNTVTSDIEFRPLDWLTFYSDSEYSAKDSRLTSANFEVYINQGKKWALSIAKRYHVDVDDQITTELTYVLNPKWKFKIYDRFDIGGGGQKEQEFTITRDLHCWEMDMSYNETRGQGSEIWLVFRLKAFPEQTIDLFGTSFNKRKAGGQSSGE